MRWPWGRRPEVKARVLGLSEELGSFLIFGEGSAASPSSALSLYEKSDAVAIPVNFVAEAFAVTNPVMKVGDEVIREHPVLDLIRRPSSWMGQELFLEALGKNYLVTGEFCVAALGNRRAEPLELVALSPKSMTPVRDMNSDFPARWHVSGNTLAGTYEREARGKDVRYADGPLRELAVYRNFSARDNSLLRGQSPLLAASRKARQDVLASRHNVSLLEKGGRVSLVFHFAEDMSEDDFEEVKKRVKDQFAGPGNAGEIVVTSGGKLEIKEHGLAPKDMDYPSLTAAATKSVALTYKVPLPLVTEARQTLSNYREAKVALYDDAVIPLSRRVLGGLADFLFPRFGIDPAKATLAIDPDDVPALQQRRNEELLKRVQARIETPNELRATVGREPVEGGDSLLQPANLVPIGTDLFTEDNEEGIADDSPEGLEVDRD